MLSLLNLSVADAPALAGIRVEFIFFALTLLCVALFHHHTLKVALTGVITIALYKVLFTGFPGGEGLEGLGAHLVHEWVVVTNLFALLVGFAVLARHFEESEVPHVLPRFLPNDWKGPLVLLVMVWVMSAFLDNIAAALIGGTVAATVFKRRVHIGYLAAIVASSNAGGAGSVVGDTTTTMMWIDGVSPLDVTHAFVGAAVALVVIGIFGARLQHAYQPIQKDADRHVHIDWARIGIVVWILVAAIGTNIVVNTYFKERASDFPFLGAAVWVAILAAIPVRKPEWSLLPEAIKGSIFLLALVVCASMMPVEELPPASWKSAFGLGFISSVFDNIPLTALALKQGGYDWGLLAFAVGYGGSMMWFGSSAGVAVSNLFPEARSVGRWVKAGWFVPVGYVLGFLVMYWLMGWHPHDPHKE
jgi:Na+/H+ antiporter NhaD/arsenite permease-like protein